MRSLLKIAKTGYLVLSALLILAGVGLAFFSDTFYPILAVLLGILFLVFGVVKLAGFFSKDPYQLVFESDLVFGILYLALGLLLLLRPAHTMAFFGIVCGLILPPGAPLQREQAQLRRRAAQPVEQLAQSHAARIAQVNIYVNILNSFAQYGIIPL